MTEPDLDTIITQLANNSKQSEWMGLAKQILTQMRQHQQLHIHQLCANLHTTTGTLLPALTHLHTLELITTHHDTIRIPATATPTTAPTRTTKKRVGHTTPKNTALTTSRCHTCGTSILAGYHGGWHYQLDSDPLTQKGEHEELDRHNTTFTVTTADRWKTRNNVWDQNTPYPTGLRPTIHRQHHCDNPPLTDHTRRPLLGAVAQDTQPRNQPCPDIGEPPY